MKRFLPVVLAFITLQSLAQGPYCTAPATYYDGLTGLNCNALKAALFAKISAGYVEQTNSAMWALFEKTDKHRNDANTADIVWDMYTDRPNATGDCEFRFVTDQDNGTLGNAECQKFNREHTMPQSWFSSGTPMVTDLFEVYPTDKFINAQHDNFPYGEVNGSGSGVVTYANGSRKGPSAIAGITGTVFEPIDEYKGDLARSFLYMATRYHDQVASWDKMDPSGDKALDGKQYPAFEIPYLKMLLKWHHQDPVSQKEINRNNAIYCFQKNRNPYIDHPELVDLVWNPTCSGAEALPVDLVQFKASTQLDVVMLNWDAATELNLRLYVVERSSDGKNFFEAGRVNPTGTRSYQFADNVGGFEGNRFYYRLKMVDTDGKINYSAVVMVLISGNTLFTLFPNPTTDLVKINFSKTVKTAKVQVTDMAGRVQYATQLKQVTGPVSLNLARFAAGTYLVTVDFEGEKKVSKLQVIH